MEPRPPEGVGDGSAPGQDVSDGAPKLLEGFPGVPHGAGVLDDVRRHRIEMGDPRWSTRNLPLEREERVEVGLTGPARRNGAPHSGQVSGIGIMLRSSSGVARGVRFLEQITCKEVQGCFTA